MMNMYNKANKNKSNERQTKKDQKKSIDISKSIDLSNINKKDSECSTNMKKHFADSNNKTDESIIAAPAFIIGEKDPEWDSFLDDTKI